jgi:hypothetical protein
MSSPSNGEHCLEYDEVQNSLPKLTKYLTFSHSGSSPKERGLNKPFFVDGLIIVERKSDLLTTHD